MTWQHEEAANNMKGRMPMDFHEYCQLIEKKVKRISPDEVETAKLFEKLITKYNIKKVKRVCLAVRDGEDIHSPSSDSFFNDHYVANKPIIITNLGHKIGKCTQTYSNKNVIQHIGSMKVSIHISTSKFLNNIEKNFRYKLSSLTNFIQLIGEEDQKKSRFSLRYNEGGKEVWLLLCKAGEGQHNLPPHHPTVETTTKGRDNQMDDNEQEGVYGEKRHYYYYRSLGTNQFKDVSNIKKMNHFIRDSFFLPAQIYPPHDEFEFFSSILRIGQTNIFIWLHYDIPDNFLIQVKGRKKILLIPPKFIKYFQIVNSSSPYNLFHILMGRRKKLTKREKVVKKILCKFALVADLYQGDILFIPSLWLHYVYNMPAHTYVKRKYRSYHEHLRVETEQESVQFAAQNEWEEKFPSNCRKMLNQFTPLKRGRYAAVMERYPPRDKQNRHEIKLLPQWGNIPLRNNNNEASSNKPSDIKQDELIQHYSHLENYQHFLEHHFGIRISDIEGRSCDVGSPPDGAPHKNSPAAILSEACEGGSPDTKENAQQENEANSNGEIKRGHTSHRHTCSSAKLNISVNYFFRKRKERLLFSKKDLYGNQDIILASQLFKKIQHDIQPLLDAPPKYRNFYLQKLQGILYSHLDDQYV
ncbi:hypothetical protein C922_03211 [Plasmodium inui San Antonio 1]|uniref:JmjC domain-containing protein n=1 Tax=Plasmodium inui San Antonio 1 TaxID=1237626 RepID=W7A3R7_9APIC|nr:hypothetical protein C922_03211 [Plasmodium inui San Antonio 1]EUD66295.1 hypothetical protein C922_03211 [Plasmodium inui San Antonio 1]